MVLSHNDPNPSNLVFDGERVLLLDWDSAGANDPLSDLAAVALFLRMDDAACAQLIAAHDQAQVDRVLPRRFLYLRRLLAALCGTLFLGVARAGGHRGSYDGARLEAPRLGAGNARTPVGQWMFGQGLLRASVGERT
jgi:hypothetical protein